MEWVKTAIQLTIAVSIFNVWIFRFKKATRWRGGNAKNMKDEFESYGLPVWFMKCIGFLKVTLAALMLAGLALPALTLPSAIGLAVLMLGAIAMHIKVKDSPLKSLPAFGVLVLCLFLIISQMLVKYHPAFRPPACLV